MRKQKNVHPEEVSSVVLIYDVVGDTFDFSSLTIEDGILEVTPISCFLLTLPQFPQLPLTDIFLNHPRRGSAMFGPRKLHLREHVEQLL